MAWRPIAGAKRWRRCGAKAATWTLGLGWGVEFFFLGKTWEKRVKAADFLGKNPEQKQEKPGSYGLTWENGGFLVFFPMHIYLSFVFVISSVQPGHFSSFYAFLHKKWPQFASSLVFFSLVIAVLLDP